MHADTSRLLQDFDGINGGNHEPVYDTETRYITWNVNANQWMAQGVYRYYDLADDQPGVVEGITVAFIEKDNPSNIDEPLLIAGQLKYKLNGGSSVRGICQEWDLWNAHFFWFDAPGSAAPIPL